MDRRMFIRSAAAGIPTVAASPAIAQPAGKMARIGVLANSSANAQAGPLLAFRQGLRELGWVEGQNIAIEYRGADGQLEKLPALAAELVKLPVDLIVTSGPPAVRASLQASLKARVFRIRTVADLDTAFGAAASATPDGVHVLPSPFFAHYRKHIAELAIKHRLPSISESRDCVVDGGLMSYGPSFPGMWRRAASPVDRILKGAKPGELPIEQPARFELVVNMKTARAIGLAIPPSLLLRADEVIE